MNASGSRKTIRVVLPLAVGAVAAGVIGFALIRRSSAAPVVAPAAPASKAIRPAPRPTVRATPYVTRAEDIVVPAWVRVGDEMQTVTPLRDNATGGFAHLSYAGALSAAAANSADLISRSGVEARSEAARASNLELSPVTLPDVAMMRTAGIDPKDRAAVGAFLNAQMRSKEWAKVHDDRAQAQLNARGWDGQSVTSNIGKPWVSGARAGRGRLFGWRLPNGSWIQPEEDAHDDAWSDYATTTILRRPIS